ncbi:MAG: CHAT domain-containing protein [Hyphomicrobium sp.]|uniref:CHAT domain-containing tetratricopeptide repeat protein n=1 Tax=Hyphomicrobium sp. TaxID=82 RepID=UPI0039E5BA68
MHGLIRFLIIALMATVATVARATENTSATISALAAAAKYDDALTAAIALEKQTSAANNGISPDHAVAVSWIAFLKSVLGDRAGATPFYEQAVDIYSKVTPARPADYATSLNNLGYNRAETGRTTEAEQLYLKALDLRERNLPPNSPAIADTLNNLAQLYKGEGHLEDALPLLNRALEIRTRSLPPNDPLIASSLQNLAGAMELDPAGDKFVAAQHLLEKALEIRRNSQTANHPEIAGVISKLATNLFNQGKFSAAETRFEEALQMRRKSQPANHPDIASTLLGLGMTDLELKRYSAAEAEFREALAIREAALAPASSKIADTLSLLAGALDGQGRLAEALDAMRRATKIRLQGGDITASDQEYFYHHLDLLAEAVSDKAQADKLLSESFLLGQNAEQSEAASAVAKMAARFATHDPALQDLVRERDEQDAMLSALERQFSDDLGRPPEKRNPDTRRDMQKLQARRVEIDAALKKGFPKYFELVKPDAVGVDAARQLLKPNEALISIASGPDFTFVWAISRDHAAWQKVETSRDWLSSSVKSLRPSLDTEDLKAGIGNGGALFDLGLSYELYAKLLQPLESVFKDKSHLIIVPSGALTSLPFQVLITKKPGTPQPKLEQLGVYHDADWLIRDHSLSVLPSVNSLRSLRQLGLAAATTKPMIGFGNPALKKRVASNANSAASLQLAELQTRGLSRSPREILAENEIFDRLEELPTTETELRAVAKDLGAANDDLELGPNATETRVKQSNLAIYNVVYFATHGLVADDLKGTLDEPALVLSRPEHPDAYDDGFLTASEISEDLKLNADWVVLAACNTASADSKPGAEALSGLAKAFFHAGARALLVSHWRVESESAARLTTATFAIKSKNKSMGRAEALREAMLAEIDRKPVATADLWNAYPAFWAPFSVVGEGG